MEAVNICTMIMLITRSNLNTVGGIDNDSIEVGGTADTKADPEAWSSAAVHSTRRKLPINNV